MQVHQRIWHYLQQHRMVSIVVGHITVVGAIVDLQPWVQRAYSLGHVAVVERILQNRHVIASTMNWGAYPWRVTYVEYAPGPGVTFISY